MKQMKDLVSIVIPVYRVEEYLNECIDSVVNQTYTYKEIFVIDDGSDDQSGSISDEYAILDSNLITIHKHNGGLSSARNTGIFAATGKYIYFIDSDDYIELNAIDCLVEQMESAKADFISFDGKLVFSNVEYDNNIYDYKRINDYPAAFSKKTLISMLEKQEYRPEIPLYFYNREYLERNKIIFENEMIHEDELFSAQVFLSNGICKYCDARLYNRRIRPNSIMTEGSSESRMKDFQGIAKSYYGLAISNKRFENDIAWDAIMTKLSKDVMSKYHMLNDQQRAETEQEYKAFIRTVRRNHYYNDDKLKIKCSAVPMKQFYKLLHKTKGCFVK